MTQNETDNAMMKMAITWGMNSKAKRFKVGALIVKNHQIISDGFNGTPSGFDNTCEDIVTTVGDVLFDLHHNINPALEYKTKSEVLHAESNAISKLAKHGGTGSDGATIYTTVAPCVNCAKLIIQAGIKRVVFGIQYRDDSGVKLLQKAGIEIIEKPRFSNFYQNLLAYKHE